MKLSELARKPQLISITIDDAEIVEQYGEPIEFWTWDRQPLDVFVKMAAVDGNNYASVVNAVKELILDESGRPLLTGEVALPTQVMMRVLNVVVERLGKS